MLRIRQVQFAWTSGHQVAHIIELAGKDSIAGRGLMTLGTWAVPINAALFDDFGLGEILDPLEGDIGNILTRPEGFRRRGGRLGVSFSHAPSLPLGADFGITAPVMGLQSRIITTIVWTSKGKNM